MSASFRSLLFVFMIAGLASACSHTSNKTQVRQETETTKTQSVTDATPAPAVAPPPVAETGEQNVISRLDFTSGQKTLSPEATAELNRALMEARQKGEVESVDVVVWSDASATTKNQPRSQIQIAKERGQNIEKYVDRMEPAANVQVHNMATRPGAFLNYLNEQDDMTRQQLSQMGVAADPETDEVYGQSSSALVLIKMK